MVSTRTEIIPLKFVGVKYNLFFYLNWCNPFSFFLFLISSKLTTKMITNYISFYSLTIKVNYKLNKSSCKKNFMKNQSTSFAPFFLFLFSPAVFSLWIFNLSFVSNAKWLIFKHVKSIGMNQWSYNPVLLSLSFKDVKLMKLEIFIPRLS